MSDAKPLTLSDAAPLLEPYLLRARSSAEGAVLAVSGGPDSVALMRFAAGVRTIGESVPIVVATVDHGLRPESRHEAELVASWAKACGFPHRVLPWTGDKPRARLQEAAREARYGLLAAFAKEAGASHVLTAHTLDDQAETILMRLARGTGIAGLAGMRAETALQGVAVARPFLGLAKARLLAACRTQGWPFLQDPSNADPRFARTRLRHHVMPVLAREGLTAERLASLAIRAQRIENALDHYAIRAIGAAGLTRADARIELDGAALLAEPEAVFLRVVARTINEVAGERLRPVRLERLEEHVLGGLRPALASGTRYKVNLAAAAIEARVDRRLIFTPEMPRKRNPG